MDLFDVIIIGSGPSGVAATLSLESNSVLMLDVGIKSKIEKLPKQKFSEIKNVGENFNSIIGEKFEALKHFDEGYLSPKLKGPLMRFILEIPQILQNKDSFKNFQAHISYAQGGLANAWGAGLMKYSDVELKSFPITEAELKPYYNYLTELIGISGLDDDLLDYFGDSVGILPPLNLSFLAKRLEQKYFNNRERLNSKGIFLGRPRLAVLTQEYRGRPAYKYLNQDFFQPNGPSIFNPTLILEQQIAEGKIDYRPNILVTSFREDEVAGIVRVQGKNLASGELVEFAAKSILVAAGTLNSTRIVLESFGDYRSKLPLLDNKVSLVPFVDLALVGSRFSESNFSGAELIVIDKSIPESIIQASVYGLNGVMRSEMISEFPLSIKANLALTKYLGSALGMMQVFYPDRQNQLNYISLKESGGLHVEYCEQFEISDKALIRMLQRFGYLTTSLLKKELIAGSSIHYAGSIPMVDNPISKYQTDRFCRLNNTSRVFIVDGAVFPDLPAKNHSFTLMANSMRVAAYVSNNILKQTNK